MANKLSKMLTLHEGRKAKLYRCTAGKLTIGVGHNIEDRGLSDAAIDFILQEDIAEAAETLRDRVDGFSDLSEVRQAVLIDMCFNLGWPRLAGFRGLLSALAAGDYGLAAAEMLDSRWARQVGQRAVRLAEMMRTDEWCGEVV